jgi:hypothetical protein
MRILGFLCVIVASLTILGYCWFSIATTHAAGMGEISWIVDEDKLCNVARTADCKLGQSSPRAMVAVRSLGCKASAEDAELNGTLVVVDRSAARGLTLTTGSATIELQVPNGIPVTRDGNSVGFEALQPATRVRLTFAQADEVRSLAWIEILR